MHETDLKVYGCRFIGDYYDIIRESMVNGNRKQAIDQFLKLSKAQRKEYLKALVNDVNETGDKLAISMLRIFIDLIY